MAAVIVDLLYVVSGLEPKPDLATFVRNQIVLRMANMKTHNA
jgi:hypothetical protein